MRYVISELDVFSLGRVVAVVYAAGSLVMWLFVPIFLILPTGGESGAAFAKGLMLLFFVAAPILNAVIGFVFGVLAGVAYNLLAGSIGGLGLTLRQEA